MKRSVNIALNKFNPIPNSLKKSGLANRAIKSVDISLASLYHHYYLDNYGRTPPDPDPAQFEYLRFLANTQDFRLRSNGIGVSTAARRNRSNELGQAFCRLFLHDFLTITYFAHIEHVLNKEAHPMFGGIKVERCSKGDSPDYLCSRNAKDVYLAEAKGRYSSINFNNAEFKEWRSQFDRVVVKNALGTPLYVKGFIVGTRFVTEENRASTQTTVYAEDPQTPGEVALGDENQQFLGPRITAVHYSNIAEKLNQPLLAASLLNNYIVPDEIIFPVFIWELVVGPLSGRRFVGGYYSRDRVNIIKAEQGLIFGANDPFDLNAPRVTFFGLEEGIFETVIKIARHGVFRVGEFPTLDQIEPFYSGVSILRDGSMIAPIDFVRLVEQVNY
jgi:hypothetical protein